MGQGLLRSGRHARVSGKVSASVAVSPQDKELAPCGTTYKLAISKDPEQKYLFVADGTNNRVWILARQSGETLGSFGGNGRYAGQLHWINAIAVDSRGNVYTGEVEHAKRIQKFEPVMATSP